MSKQWSLSAVLILVSLVGQPVLAAGSGPDDLWEVTVKMEGMPMAMGPQSTKVCVQKGKDENTVPMDKNCRMLDFKRSGNKTSYRFKCSGDMEMTGSGEVTMAADHKSYQGNMQMKGEVEGRTMEMKQSYSGKRVGNCSYAAQEQEVATRREQGQARMKEMDAMMQKHANAKSEACTPKDDQYELEWMHYQKNGMCAEYRGAACKRAKAIAGEMSSDPEVFLKMNETRDRWTEGMRGCGVKPEAIKPPCKQGVAKRNWKLVALHCEKEMKTIAKKECAGRDYTSAMESEYAPICQEYARQNVGKNVFSEGKSGGKASKESASKESISDQATEKLKGGLKGMFGF